MGTKSNKKLIAFILTVALIMGGFVFGVLNVGASDFNKQINYQGKLTDSAGDAVTDGTYHMKFRLYDALTGGTELWEGDRSVDAGDRVSVASGLFSVMLGSSTPLTSVDFNQTLYLEVEIGGTSGSSWETLSPRKILGDVRYIIREST